MRSCYSDRAGALLSAAVRGSALVICLFQEAMWVASSTREPGRLLVDRQSVSVSRIQTAVDSGKSFHAATGEDESEGTRVREQG